MDPALLASTNFGDQSEARWRALAAKALKGADVDAALSSNTDDGIVMFANNPRVASKAPLFTRRKEGWAIVQHIDDVDLPRAAAQAKAEIEGGANGLSLVFEGAESAHGYGLPAHESTISAVFDGINLEGLTIRIEPHPHSRLSAEWLADYLRQRKVKRINLSLGIDQASILASTGRLKMTLEALEASLPQSLSGFFAAGIPGVLLEADGRVYHNAGATEAQELGAVLSIAASHLRMFETARQPVSEAADHVGFALSVDQDQFVSIAKLRAVRLLWQRVLELSGVKDAPRAFVHAQTSFRMLSRLDAETNILRSTIAVFAAATGGADSVSVLPHSMAHGLPDSNARRIARNTQLVLREESRLGFVDDPAAGSGAVETLTEHLCQSAWSEFQRLESEGGVLRSLLAGALQARIAQAQRARQASFEAQSRTIIGTTAFPANLERTVDTLQAQRPVLKVESSIHCQALKPARLAEPFEKGAS